MRTSSKLASTMFGLVLVALMQVPAWAQSSDTSSSRPATSTTSGDTGLWTVPTGEVLPAKKWSLNISRLQSNMGQGFLNVSSFPVSVGVGLGHRLEVFGSWRVLTRLDHDTRPLFFEAADPNGTGGGIDVDYPLHRTTFTSTRGDLWIGGKVNVLSTEAGRSVALGIRPMVKIPTGDKDKGTTSGKLDESIDVVFSGERAGALEISGYGGYLHRGDPDGYELTDSFRWGFGAAFPSRFFLRGTAELYGERYLDDTITAPAGLVGVDGSRVPTSTRLESPVFLHFGLTFQMPTGFFIGAGLNWNLTMASRKDASPIFGNESLDAADYLVRIGFHPGVRRVRMDVAAPAAPVAPVVTTPTVPTPAAPAAQAAAAPANRPPTVRALCDPCRVEVGRVATVTADAQDPDGDALTYAWTATAGTLASPTARQSPWTAPQQVGPVPFTVTVNDGKGGTANATVTIDVFRAAAAAFQFVDITFDFDRYTLNAEAIAALGQVVTALNQDSTLSLEIQGHTDDIGTAEYNLALGQRRAAAVRDYLVSRGVAASRLSTVSFGEEAPKYDNSREETRMLNRRAAVTVRLVRN